MLSAGQIRWSLCSKTVRRSPATMPVHVHHRWHVKSLFYIVGPWRTILLRERLRQSSPACAVHHHRSAPGASAPSESAASSAPRLAHISEAILDPSFVSRRPTPAARLCYAGCAAAVVVAAATAVLVTSLAPLPWRWVTSIDRSRCLSDAEAF